MSEQSDELTRDYVECQLLMQERIETRPFTVGDALEQQFEGSLWNQHMSRVAARNDAVESVQS